MELAAACPMQAPISICVHRAPDFFALNRLEGVRWSVAAAENGAGRIVGCIALAVRHAWLDGEAAEIAYVSDLKVHPAYRGQGVANALSLWAREWCRRVRPDIPVVIAVLGGNKPMERRIQTSRCMPPLTTVGTVRVHTIPLLFRRRLRTNGTRPAARVARASREDLEEMVDLWGKAMRSRQLSTVIGSVEHMDSWIERASGLELSDYWIARDGSGRLLGYLALWDQRPLKQLHVEALTLRGAAIRGTVNAVAPILGAARLPGSGHQLACAAAVHVCLPPDRAKILGQILTIACNELRGRYSFLTIGLDPRDTLAAGLRRFRHASLPTDVRVLVTSPDGRFTGPAHPTWPVHFETALV
jgi:GNAT superfamily N-acetyltransferase